MVTRWAGGWTAASALLAAVGCSLSGFAGGGGGAAGAGGGAGGAGAGAGGDGVGGCPPCACGAWAEIRVTDPGAAATLPSLAWASDHWALAWQESRDGNAEIYFARLDAGGARLGAEVRVTSDVAQSLTPSLVWSGNQHAIGYEDTRTGLSAAYLSSVDAAGQALVLDLQVWQGSGAPQHAVLAWGGSAFGYVLAWEDFRDGGFKIHSGAVSEAGAVTASDQRITDATGDALRPALVYGELEHGLVWQDSRSGDEEIYFARLDPGGLRIGGEVRVSQATGTSREAAIAFSGSSYGLVWSDARDDNAEIYFAALTQGGVLAGAEGRLSSDPSTSLGPAIVWAEGGWAVAWQDGRDGPESIYFVRLDETGAPLAPEAQIADSGGSMQSPALAWSGSAFGVAWQDDRDGSSAIYFATCAP